jgi:hypothetical protein
MAGELLLLYDVYKEENLDNKKKGLPIFYYAFHSKPQSTDKLHIITRSYGRNPRETVNQQQQAQQQPDPSVEDYGLIVESECGLKGILLKPDKDAIRESDFEGMGLRHFREKFSDIDVVYFFMPPVLRGSMPEAISQVGIIPEDKICEICKKDLQANIREATSVLQEEKEKEKEENGTIPNGKTDSSDGSSTLLTGIITLTV